METSNSWRLHLATTVNSFRLLLYIFSSAYPTAGGLLLPVMSEHVSCPPFTICRETGDWWQLHLWPILIIKSKDIVSLLYSRCCFGCSWVKGYRRGKHKQLLGGSGGWVGMIPYLSWVLSQSKTRDVCGENNHTVQHLKSRPDEREKINMSMLIACDAIKPQTNSRVSERRALSIHRRMPLLKEQRRDLNKLKNLPGERPGGRRRADGMENTGSARCVHWEEWMDKLKAMAFLAIFTAMRHYWFLRRKRILNVSRDPAFLSLSHSYTNSVSAPCSQQKKWLRSASWHTAKSPPSLMHAILAFGTMSTHLNGQRMCASTICSLLTRCSKSSL